MSRRKRRRARPQQATRADTSADGSGVPAASSGATAAPTAEAPRNGKKPLVPWRDRAREVLTRLRSFAKDRFGFEIEAFLREGYGDALGETPVPDLERAFDDFVCASGSGGDGRSVLATWIGEDEALELDERRQLLTWEKERARCVYLLDRCQRDQMELWDPVHGGRVTVQLLERMSKGRVAELSRGTVVIATTAPWGARTIALGPVEIYGDDDAINLYRKEVRELGRLWHELPAPTPS